MTQQKLDPLVMSLRDIWGNPPESKALTSTEASSNRASLGLLYDSIAAAEDPGLVPDFLDGTVLHGVKRDGVGYVLRVMVSAKQAAACENIRGCSLVAVSEHVATGEIPLDMVDHLEADDNIEFVMLDRALRIPLDGHDSSVDHSIESHGYQSSLDHLSNGATRNAATGRGVVVGVVDTFIDFCHPAFLDRDGRQSRIKHIWLQQQDSSSGGTAPLPWGYGRSYDHETIECARNSEDPYAVIPHRPGEDTPDIAKHHGTVVTGIACGAVNVCPTLPGVASDADIIFVSTVDSGFSPIGSMKTLADAIGFIFERAGSAPCVINLSLGDNLGPRDGSSPVEQVIDDLVTARAGRAVVVSAGNSKSKHASAEDANQWHAAGNFNIPVRRQFAIKNPARYAILEVWLAEPCAGLRLSICHVKSGANASLDGPPVQCLDNGAQVWLARGAWRRTGQELITIRMLVDDGARGSWVLTLAGSSTGAVAPQWRAALERDELVSWDGNDNNCSTVMTPATAKHAICVGGYSVSAGDFVHNNSSARGPSTSGEALPHLLALGTNVGAPLWRGKSVGSAASCDLYRSSKGTSVAAPAVTGAVARMFEVSPEFTAQQIRTHIMNAAINDVRGDSGAIGRGRCILTTTKGSYK